MHSLCDEHEDVPTASLLENWIDETERCLWFPLRGHPAGSELNTIVATCCRRVQPAEAPDFQKLPKVVPAPVGKMPDVPKGFAVQVFANEIVVPLIRNLRNPK